MIAVHAALYVFQSDNSSGEAGLYKYRYIVYPCWIIYPTLMASLAFVNHNEAYQSWGTICALPVRPFWYRLALSWIPRYLIIFTIIALYIAIYVYVHYKFEMMDKQSGNSYKNPPIGSSNPPRMSENDEETETPEASREAPIALALQSHNLLPSNRTSAAPPENSGDPQQQDSRTASWENYCFGGTQPVPPPSTSANALDPPLILTSDPSTDSRASTPSISTNPEVQRRASTTSTTESVPRSNYYLIKALRNKKRISSLAPHYEIPNALSIKNTNNQNTAPSALEQTDGPIQQNDSPHQHVGNQSLRQRQAEIKRKLRLLFIYPLIYMIMWLVPFASHCLQYTDYYSQNPPYGLSVAVTVFLPLQGAADSLMFSIREKPWRYVGKGRLFPWGKPTTALRRPSGSLVNPDSDTGAGTDEEQAQGKEIRNVPKRPPEPRKERSWWEIEGRMRMDSVMLGTDHNYADHGGPGHGSEGTRTRRPTIPEEEEPVTPREERDQPANVARPAAAPVAGHRGYGGLHSHKEIDDILGRNESEHDTRPV